MSRPPEPGDEVATAAWANGLRSVGTVPHWAPGDAVWWHYRRCDWQPGEPETVHPMRGLPSDLAPGPAPTPRSAPRTLRPEEPRY